MSRLSTWIRNFFGFSRTEINAFLILLPLMVVLISSAPVYRYWVAHQPRDFSKERRELDSLAATWKWENPDKATPFPPRHEQKHFLFNPNTASRDELIDLGFGRPLADRLIRYRSKGGKFNVKKDLMKIYGLDTSFYGRILDDINLPERIAVVTKTVPTESKKKQASTLFNLNNADTSQLIAVYGIGSKLSRRIVAYREKLGGFILPEQLSEVYGLDTTTVRALLRVSFIAGDFMPQLIDINKATEQQLASHPYIRYKLAKAITAYRFQHGAYHTTEDLKKITQLSEETFQKIKPYLSVNL